MKVSKQTPADRAEMKREIEAKAKAKQWSMGRYEAQFIQPADLPPGERPILSTSGPSLRDRIGRLEEELAQERKCRAELEGRLQWLVDRVDGLQAAIG